MANLFATDFYGQRLTIVKDGDVPYIALRPIVESLGLDWTTQRQKIKEDSRFSWRGIPSTARDGKQYQTTCIPLKKLNAFLFSINPNKVRSDLREMLEHYQEECAAALFSYWTHGYAINPHFQTPEQQHLFNTMREQHTDLPRTITVTEAWKFLLTTQSAGVAPSRLTLLNMVKRGRLTGHKTEFGYVIDRAAFDDFIRRLKLKM